MTFWLEMEWQTAAASRVRDALKTQSAELLQRGLTDGQWTKPMLAALAPVAHDLCGNAGAACSFGGGEEFGHRKGWLYDFCCWVTDAEQRLIGLPIVVESEWREWSEVLDDFEKLLQVRAGLRVLIFQHDSTTPLKWEDDLLLRTRLFAQCEAEDAWLFVQWRDGKFEFASNRCVR